MIPFEAVETKRRKLQMRCLVQETWRREKKCSSPPSWSLKAAAIAGLNCSLRFLPQVLPCVWDLRFSSLCEQSGTELLRHPCHIREEGESMDPSTPPRRNRLRRSIVSMQDWFGKLFSLLGPQTREARSQRMCPFCGLITPS